MGDKLAEELYRAFVNASGQSYGSDETPGWHNLRTEQREAWEVVASRARNEMAGRFATELDRARTNNTYDGLVAAIDVLRARWGR